MGFRFGRKFDFSVAAAFTAATVKKLVADEMQPGVLVNINCPAGDPTGVEVTRLGKRLYNDELRLVEEDEETGRRRYEIYGFEPSFEDEAGSDLTAVARGRISVTPVHFDLTDDEGLPRLRDWDLDAMLAGSLDGKPSAEPKEGPEGAAR
jgi:5'-nucleotidase